MTGLDFVLMVLVVLPYIILVISWLNRRSSDTTIENDLVCRVTCTDASTVELGAPKLVTIKTVKEIHVSLEWEYHGLEEPAFFQFRNAKNGRVLQMVKAEAARIGGWRNGDVYSIAWQWVGELKPEIHTVDVGG